MPYIFDPIAEKSTLMQAHMNQPFTESGLFPAIELLTDAIKNHMDLWRIQPQNMEKYLTHMETFVPLDYENRVCPKFTALYQSQPHSPEYQQMEVAAQTLLTLCRFLHDTDFIAQTFKSHITMTVPECELTLEDKTHQYCTLVQEMTRSCIAKVKEHALAALEGVEEKSVRSFYRSGS
jgi:hypothetical protein